MAHIAIENLTKFFGTTLAVNDVTLAIKDREFAVLLGPSGCGKSTILNCLAGLEKPSSGKIFIDGRDMEKVPPHKRNIAMVFQNYALYPHMSVYNNLSFPLKMLRVSGDEISERISRAARILQIENIKERKPSELSGGQRQRVALGRAIVRNPGAFLMDEPLSNLDAALRNETRGELKKLHAKINATFVYVTHDQSEAMSMADRIAILKDGALLQMDTPYRIYREPADTFVASFLGSPPINLIRGRLISRGNTFLFNSDSLEVVLNGKAAKRLGDRSGPEVIMGVRPEHISILPPERSSVETPLEVLLVEPLGAETILEVSTRMEKLKLKVMGDPGIQVGARVRIKLNTDSLLFFDPATGKNLLST
ncbi:MAG: ABC transporter ATP-binding protein [Deltaproteobacteria bacterium]|nr:ABC transporter ATP-binding protein [Deltaproteobacteria bacterium]MBW2308034.1 ABC transporter ATP-binding protein [Deltaproteobacteria bacterium]